MRFIITAFVFLILCSNLLAQQLYLQRYAREVYRGSPQNWAFAEDRDQNLYVANNDGIVTYDGQKWGLLSLPQNKYVFSLAIDRSGNIYLGSYHELGYMHRQAGGAYRYTSLTTRLPTACKDISDIGQTLVYRDQVFFNDMQNVLLYSKGKFRRFAIENRWLYAGNDKLYLIVKNGLLEFDGNEFKPAPFNKLLKGMQVRRLTGFDSKRLLLLDTRGKLWLLETGSDSRGALLPFAGQIYGQLKDPVVRKILALDNGNYALCTSRELLVVNGEGHMLNYMTGESLGLDLGVAIMFQDVTHNLWLASTSVIEQVISSSPLSYYDDNQGLKGVMLAFSNFKGHKFAASSEGLFELDNRHNFHPVPGVNGQAEQFYKLNDQLYLAHDSGVYVFRQNRFDKLLDHAYVQSLTQLQCEDCMLFGTYNSGIWVMRKKGGKWVEQKVKGFDDEARHMRQDARGNIWISHNNHGIFRLRLNKELDSFLESTLYDVKKGLPANTNNRLLPGSGAEIRVSTEDGIYVFNAASDRFEKDSRFSSVLGKGFTIYSLSEGESGDQYFWGAASKDLETEGHLTKQPGGKYASDFTPFKKLDLPTNSLRVDVDAPQLVLGANEVWMGINDKIVVYRPQQKTFFTDSLPVHITDAVAGDHFLPVLASEKTLHVPFSRQRMKFQFAAQFNEEHEKLLYAYFLEGFDDHWSAWLPTNTATFTNLTEGDYCFYVKAKNLYGKTSGLASFHFHIDAPWYRTWWACVLYLVLLALFFTGLLRLNFMRMRRQKKSLQIAIALKTAELQARNEDILKKNREIVAQSEHLEVLNETKDKLFSILSHDLRGPVGQVDQTLKLIEDGMITPAEFETLLPELSSSSSSVLGLIDNLLFWAQGQKSNLTVNPVWFELSEIFRDNHALFKRAAESKGINLNNSLSEGIELFADREMIRLVMRNLVNNAIKFTQRGGRVILGAELNENSIRIFVKDTGIGMTGEQLAALFGDRVIRKTGTAGEKGVGLGLAVSKEFIEKNESSLQVSSETGIGTRFYFDMKIFRTAGVGLQH